MALIIKQNPQYAILAFILLQRSTTFTLVQASRSVEDDQDPLPQAGRKVAE